MTSPHDGPPDADATYSAHLVHTFRIGDVLCDRFVVTRFIARGGMGELYEAEDRLLSERVALKTIRPEIALDERAHQRFRREVQLARKVTHPNICRIFDVFHSEPIDRSDGDHAAAATFVTMELLEGETLRHRLRQGGRFSPEEARGLLSQMAEALAAAHAAGVVHRDFKSSNVMLLDAGPGRPPRVVVTDFGLAYRLDDTAMSGASITMSGDLVGTPEYMAPEQLEGNAVTPATDIYALGLVAYEMLTGERPFTGSTPMAVAITRLSRPPAAPRTLVPTIPVDLDRAIIRCLAIDPASRFPSAQAFVDALAASPVTRRRSRGRAAVLVAAAVLMIASAVFAWRWRPASPRQDTGRPAVAAIDRARGRRARIQKPGWTSRYRLAVDRSCGDVDDRARCRRTPAHHSGRDGDAHEDRIGAGGCRLVLRPRRCGAYAGISAPIS